MGKRGAEAGRALLAGEGLGFGALTCKSPSLLLSFKALQHASNYTAQAVPYPHPRASWLSVIRMETLSCIIRAVASSLRWHPPGNPASSLSMGFD